LTLIGPVREDRFGHDVLLSRSRFLAPATHSLRFYREYFKPKTETSIEKDRQRWKIEYKGLEFFINLDEVRQPALGYYLEIKSTTWSRQDAIKKAALLEELTTLLGAHPEKTEPKDYIEMITN
ncbi:MAG: amidohydrolase, partial [Anaerolineales bacterium]